MIWKEKRKLSYLMNTFDDIGLAYQYIDMNSDEIINMVIDFFENGSKLIYPPKSYFVAIIYAHYLNKYFGDDFYRLLDDEELLPDDKYFIPYSKAEYIYDKVISKISDIEKYPSIKVTLNYFNQEFLIE
jgi:hypothetical protein